MDLLAPRGEDAGAVLPFWWIKIDIFLSEYIEYIEYIELYEFCSTFSHFCLSLSLIGAWKLVNQLHQKSRR